MKELTERDIRIILNCCQRSIKALGCEFCPLYRYENCINILCKSVLNLLDSKDKKSDKPKNDISVSDDTYPFTCNKRKKIILCVETGERFMSLKEASKSKGVLNSAISNCCRGKSKTSGGYHWRYATEEELLEEEGVVNDK